MNTQIPQAPAVLETNETEIIHDEFIATRSIHDACMMGTLGCTLRSIVKGPDVTAPPNPRPVTRWHFENNSTGVQAMWLIGSDLDKDINWQGDIIKPLEWENASKETRAFAIRFLKTFCVNLKHFHAHVHDKRQEIRFK